MRYCTGEFPDLIEREHQLLMSSIFIILVALMIQAQKYIYVDGDGDLLDFKI
mgnify:CR=1 FL=1